MRPAVLTLVAFMVEVITRPNESSGRVITSLLIDVSMIIEIDAQELLLIAKQAYHHR